MDKNIRIMIVGFIIFFAFAALVLGVVLLNTDLYGNSTPTYEGPPVIIFIMVLLGVFALIGGVILTINRR
ncbi:MAG: hypothetical protein ACW964_17460 [Candidatus Hodarchaeales archaeon]